MSEDAMMAFVERFTVIFEGANPDVVDDLFAPDFIAHLPLAFGIDREGWKAYIRQVCDGISALSQELNEVIIGEDRLVLRATYSGIHDGKLFGIPPTRTPVMLHAIGIFRFNNEGRVAELWAIADVISLLAQISVKPSK